MACRDLVILSHILLDGPRRLTYRRADIGMDVILARDNSYAGVISCELRAPSFLTSGFRRIVL